jgi:ADP-ribose pyrophosphatase
MSDMQEIFLSREDKFHGRVVSVHVVQVRLPNGHQSFREVVDHNGGVAILALDDDNNVLTVTQYRYVFGREMLEIPAGKLEENEDPASAALRELREETGATPDEFLPLGTILPSPGCYGETLHLYLARGLHFGAAQPDEDELLRVERIPFDEMVRRILNGKIMDGKTVAAVLKAKLLLNL